MPVPTKSSGTAHASGPLLGGSTTPVNGSAGWISTEAGITFIATITNGATGPTSGAQAYVEVATSAAGANAAEVMRLQAATGNNVVTPLIFPLGLDDVARYSHARISFIPGGGSSPTHDHTAAATFGRVDTY